MGPALEWDLIEGTAIRTWVSLFAGLGALLVSGTLSALPSIYPNQFPHHPAIVWASLIVGICLVLVGGLTKVPSRIQVRKIMIEPATAATSVQAKSEGVASSRRTLGLTLLAIKSICISVALQGSRKPLHQYRSLFHRQAGRPDAPVRIRPGGALRDERPYRDL